LALPYADLMRLSGYPVPGESNANTTDTVELPKYIAASRC
jgi:hypothetical protein